jgi:hypothetical protein
MANVPTKIRTYHLPRRYRCFNLINIIVTEPSRNSRIYRTQRFSQISNSETYSVSFVVYITMLCLDYKALSGEMVSEL